MFRAGKTRTLGGVEYLDVAWHHESPDYPVRLVSELNDERFEVRKLEFFADGRVGFASEHFSALGTQLGTVAVPPLHEINTDPEFEGVNIDKAAFEALWGRHARAAT